MTRRLRFLAIATMSIVLIAVLAIGGCSQSTTTSVSNNTTDESTSTLNDVPKNTYDWSFLSTVAGIRHYTDSQGNTALLGIDVSTHQGTVDWNQLVGQIGFAMIRVGYSGSTTGVTNEDDMFKRNISEANRVGIPVGAYYFSQATTTDEAVAEAKFVLSCISGYSMTYPVVFDLEDVPGSRTTTLTGAEKTQISIAFCDTIQSAGYTPMIYGNSSWLISKVYLADLYRYGIWLAEYNEQPSFPFAFTIWQYSDAGTMPGIDGTVDMDLLFGF
jgi:lysozyme